MIAFCHDLLAVSIYLRLFVILGLGYLLGYVNLRGFHLNVAAVLFVGLAFGAWDATAFALPEQLTVLGLILFVYSIGLQSGPAFFASFKAHGLKLNLLALTALGSAGLTALAIHQIFGLSGPTLAGLLAGGLTNTAALAAATDAAAGRALAAGLDAEATALAIAEPTLAYSLSYPFGVLGVMLAMSLASRLFAVSFREELAAHQAATAAGPDLVTGEFVVANSQLFGKTLDTSMIIELTGVIFTRIKSGFSVALLTPERVLAEGDILLGVGTAAALKKAAILIGPRVEAGLQTRDGPIEHRDLVVTNKELIGRRVFEVNHDPTLAVVVSRVRRGYIQLPVGPATTLEFGDQIRIVAWREQIAEAAARFGDPIKDLSETDFLSISLGIILGLLLGMVPFPLPGGHAFRFGAAGGPLLVALVLGKWGRSGPVIWTLPTNANLTLRQLGLHLFLAGIGVKAGGSFLPALVRHGLQLFFCGAVLTLVTATVTLTVGYRLLKIDMVALLGLTAGVHTQPAALAFAGDLAGSDAPNLGYATVHPLSFVVKLVLAQALVLLL